MKEPESLAEQLHVLVTMDDRTHIITREQCLKITMAQNGVDPNTGKQASPPIKTFSIGNCPVTLHQVAGMPTLEVYRRQMKTKLAEKHQRMCRRCGEIMPMQDRCNCRENNRLPVLAQASKENPKLMEYLKINGLVALALPEPKQEELPELPPTPKEREQMKVIQGYKNKFLGKVSTEPLSKDDQSGTFQKVTP